MKLSKPITELLDDNNIDWDYAPKEAVEKSVSMIKEMMGAIGFDCPNDEYRKTERERGRHDNSK